MLPLLAQSDFPSIEGQDASPDHHHDPVVPEPSTYGFCLLAIALIVWAIVASRRGLRSQPTPSPYDQLSPAMKAALARRRARTVTETHARPALDHGEWLRDLHPEDAPPVRAPSEQLAPPAVDDSPPHP